MDEKYKNMDRSFERHQSEVLCILANDWHFTKLQNFQSRPESINFRKNEKGIAINWNRPERDLRFIKRENRGAVI